MLNTTHIMSISAATVLILVGCSTNGTTDANQKAAITPFATDPDFSTSPPRETPTTSTADATITTQQTSGSTPLSNNGADADVTYVRAVESDGGTWTFHVTVHHPDTGWEDYADGWDVLTPDGDVIKPDPDSAFTRLLLHPHVGEQPFTRSQSGIVIPAGVDQVTVRAHDILDGFGGREVVVDLNADSGEDFEVDRNP